MESVGSTKLKTSLNSYLRQVQKGAGFIISDRGRPVAKLVPISDNDLSDPDEILASLISKGEISLNDLSSQKLLSSRKVRSIEVKGQSVSEMLVDDRS